MTFTFRNFHWNQISWKLSSYSRISFRKILYYFSFSPPPPLFPPIFYYLFHRTRISFDENFSWLSTCIITRYRILSKNSWLRIHVFSSDTFERYFLTFFTQVIPIEITYRRIRSIGDSRRSTGGSRPTRWDSVSTMHFSRSPRRLVHTKGIRNCCCYVAPRGGHL